VRAGEAGEGPKYTWGGDDADILREIVGAEGPEEEQEQQEVQEKQEEVQEKDEEQVEDAKEALDDCAEGAEGAEKVERAEKVEKVEKVEKMGNDENDTLTDCVPKEPQGKVREVSPLEPALKEMSTPHANLERRAVTGSGHARRGARGTRQKPQPDLAEGITSSLEWVTPKRTRGGSVGRVGE
jgi:hypothetical protein